MIASCTCNSGLVDLKLVLVDPIFFIFLGFLFNIVRLLCLLFFFLKKKIELLILKSLDFSIYYIGFCFLYFA